MTMITLFRNTDSNLKCSKCKRTQDSIYHTQNGRVFKTCNECRARALRRRMCPVFRAAVTRTRRIPDTDTPRGATRHIPYDTDTSDDDSVHHPSPAVLLLSSSAAAAASSSSSAGYFVDEPDPEPEPENP